VDNILLYKYLRTPAQVAWDYNRGKPVAQYKFDECQGTTLHDSSGNGLNGTITIGALGSNTSAGTCSSGTSTEAWNNGTTGKYNASLDFDGTNDYVSLGTNAFGDLGDTHSVSLWIKTTDSLGRILTEYNSGVCGDFTMTTDTGQITISDGASNWVNSNSTSTNDGNWHQVTFVSGVSNAYIYIDGKLDATASDVNWANGCSADVLVASEASTTKYPFDGQVDDLKVYNYQLTPEQIKMDYNQGSAVRFD
jgi:hypothetical protein